MTQGISVFFPAYNDAASIAGLVGDALALLPNLTDDFEVIVVDDGSTDGTARVLDELAREDAARTVQLVHKLDADAAARRDEFDPLDRTASDQPEVAVHVSDWNAEEKVRQAVISGPERLALPTVGAFYLIAVDDVDPILQQRAQ